MRKRRYATVRYCCVINNKGELRWSEIEGEPSAEGDAAIFEWWRSFRATVGERVPIVIRRTKYNVINDELKQRRWCKVSRIIELLRVDRSEHESSPSVVLLSSVWCYCYCHMLDVHIEVIKFGHSFCQESSNQSELLGWINVKFRLNRTSAERNLIASAPLCRL